MICDVGVVRVNVMKFHGKEKALMSWVRGGEEGGKYEERN